MGPKQYRKQIFELGIEGMEINVSTIDDAMFTLNEIKEIEDPGQNPVQCSFRYKKDTPRVHDQTTSN